MKYLHQGSSHYHYSSSLGFLYLNALAQMFILKPLYRSGQLLKLLNITDGISVDGV